MVSTLAAQQRPPKDTTHVVTLPPAVVTVTRAPDTLSRIPYGITVLRGADALRGRPQAALSEVLQNVPGVTADDRYNAARDESIAIRGFGARAQFGIRGVRVLLDGIPQTTPDGQGQLSNIDLTRVSRIEVLRGAASALYGNAAGGVVSLWTDPIPVARLTPAMRLLGGSYGRVTFTTNVSAPLGRGEVALGGTRRGSDGPRLHARSEVWNGNARISEPVGADGRLIATVSAADIPLAQDPGALTAGEVAADPGQANPRNLAANARKSVSQGEVGLTYERAPARGARVSATVYGIRRALLNPLAFATISLHRWAGGTRATVGLPFVAGPVRPVLTLGADAEWQRDDRQNTAPGGTALTLNQLEQVRELGPFGQLRVPVGRVTVTGGLRYDAVRFAETDRFLSDGNDSGTRTMDAASWTVGSAWEMTRALAPYANVGTAFETPTTTELVNKPDGSGGFNPDLGPQRATNYEVGVRGAVRRARYTVAVYRADVTGELIPFEAPGGAGRTFYRNAGSSRHEGIETSLALRPIPTLSLNVAYTYARLRFLDFTTPGGAYAGNTVPGVPEHFASVNLTWSPRAWWASAEVRTSSSVIVDDANTARANPWTLVSLRMGTHVMAGGWDFRPFAGVDNLFDERWVSSVQVNARAGRYFEPGPGRAVYLGMEMRE